MKRILLVLLATASLAVHAADNPSAKTAYETAKAQADSRYSEDRKLCAEETTSALRLQCLRDAKEVHTKALTAAENALAAAAKPAQAATPCQECGKVTGVRVTEKAGEGGALGVIAGGLAGALLGHQVGKGTGKDVATIAGAAGGAYAGHAIEGKMKKVKTWEISVRFDNGAERQFSFDHDPGMTLGDPVKLSGDSIVRR